MVSLSTSHLVLLCLLIGSTFGARLVFRTDECERPTKDKVVESFKAARSETRSIRSYNFEMSSAYLKYFKDNQNLRNVEQAYTVVRKMAIFLDTTQKVCIEAGPPVATNAVAIVSLSSTSLSHLSPSSSNSLS